VLPGDIKSSGGLKAGEGGILREGLSKLAGCRDRDGTITRIPRPHVCSVAIIRQEGSEGRAMGLGQVEGTGRGQAAPVYRAPRGVPPVGVLFLFSGWAFWDQTSHISLARRNYRRT
jgi:hypothetical protein